MRDENYGTPHPWGDRPWWRRWQIYGMPGWAFGPYSRMVSLWYRLTYCPWHGHRLKMDSYGHCVNCGAMVVQKLP